MLRHLFLVWVLVFGLPSFTFADAWPTLLGNNQRNAYSPETVDPTTLQVDWIHTDHTEPTPAWYGPAKWDAYASLPGLRSMRDYDVVDHVVAVQDGIFVGSSTSESVEGIDASSGQRRWVFFTGGPVRVAPTWHEHRIYFGSDDGFVYCLEAATGKLVWKHCPAEPSRWMIGDGRLIPLQPVRTGVLIQDGIAYYGASLLPWQPSYLCAVDAQTGSTEKAGCFVRKLDGRTFEGALACTDKLLISPQGRVPPEVFSRRDGKFLGSLPGGGGSFVVITGGEVLHGPGNKAGWITSSKADNRTKVASFPDAKAIVALPDRIILQTSDSLVATDMDRKPLWTTKTELTLSLLAVGETLFAGGQNRVAAMSAADGSILWRHDVQGRAYGLAFSEGRLIVSTDEGVITAFRQGSAPDSPDPEFTTSDQPPEVSSPPAELLKRGPTLQFLAPEEAIVRYETHQPSSSRVVLRAGSESVTFAGQNQQTTHAVRLTGLARNQIYEYMIQTDIDGQRKSTEEFECDTFFNYAPAIVAASGEDEEANELVRQMLGEAELDRGLCALIGNVDLASVSLAIAGQSKMRVIGLMTDARKLEDQRRRLLKAGIYGRRVTLRHVDSFEELLVTGRCMNLVVSFGQGFHEVARLLAPHGVGLIVDAPHDQVTTWSQQTGVQLAPANTSTRIVAKIAGQPIHAAGEWSHIYGAADNSAYGGESLSQARSADDLAVQWMGRPGPRYQADRNGRKTPPLSAAGRLYLQGLRRIVTLDRYNGSILWSLEIPAFGRYNIPRDCGNWCADEQSLFAVVNDECWQIAGNTGEVQHVFTLPDPPNETPNAPEEEWGFVARNRDLLIGTANVRGSSWTGFWGKEAWYDGTTGAVTHQVCGRRLFALAVENQRPGAVAWKYQRGVILNATVTITDDSVFFVESRNPDLHTADSGRLGAALWKDQFLVSLDSVTGELQWEIPLEVVAGTVAFYLAHGSDTLVLVSSADRQYHVYALDPKDGSSRWQTSFTWGKGKADHGSHLSRPAIVGQKLFVRPCVMDLATGEISDQKIPVAGCGTYACSENALFFRGGSGQNFAMWDQVEGKYTQWFRLRPDCWLSTIPAGGMLLSPEGGGGCSCGKWLETSIGFMPKSLLQ